MKAGQMTNENDKGGIRIPALEFAYDCSALTPSQIVPSLKSKDGIR